MADENRPIKYLRYAIGEIILVVIGILIALQINNWNEERKKKQVERNTLLDIKADIQHNIKNLEEGIARMELNKKNNLRILELVQKDNPFQDTTSIDFGNFINIWDPDFTYVSFENLKGLGVNLISNENLRKDIVELFEVKMTILDVSDMARIMQVYSEMLFPIQKKYFYRDYHTISEDWPYKSGNVKAMLADPEFFNVLTEVAYRQNREIVRFKRFNIDANQLIDKINFELSENP